MRAKQLTRILVEIPCLQSVSRISSWKYLTSKVNHYQPPNNQQSHFISVLNSDLKKGGGLGHQWNIIGGTTNNPPFFLFFNTPFIPIPPRGPSSPKKFHWEHNQHNMFNSSCLVWIAKDKLFMFTACVTDYCRYTYQVNNNTQEWYSHLWLRFADLNGVHSHNKNTFTRYQRITFEEPTQRYEA